ncbi:Choline transport [Pleurostoma richardsiae]|uniref:Choline transport n=1 Tax=Pleurostoma richardsiae TaxID=41990 RepID=A0AA38RBD3_9PEZI|nr:Choline transport [Pleurostoma richardsiae]
MAEIASVYPTAGGQYHYTSILAPRRYSGPLSYCCGSFNLFGWIVTAAGFVITVPQMITALATYWNPGYVVERWHVFLMYQALNFVFTAYNVFLSKRIVWIYDVGFLISLLGFFVITVSCLARSHPKQSSEFVWTTFIDTSGWSSRGIVFFTGLVNPNFIYSGLDGAIHLAEECTNAATVIPWALISTVTIGFVTAFAFAIAMTYSYHDFDAVLTSPLPILEVWNQALSSPAAATTFLVVLIICASFAIAGCIQTASRLTWSFARDDALVCSGLLHRIHPRLGVPVWALLANGAFVCVLGCIYLGSTTAFNALLGTGLIFQQLSFAIPAVLILGYRFRGLEAMESVLPKQGQRGKFRMPNVVGYVANILTIILGLLALVFYDLPAELPVTAGNMNYACAVFGVCTLLAVVNWFCHAKKHYHGPRLI